MDAKIEVMRGCKNPREPFQDDIEFYIGLILFGPGDGGHFRPQASLHDSLKLIRSQRSIINPKIVYRSTEKGIVPYGPAQPILARCPQIRWR